MAPGRLYDRAGFRVLAAVPVFTALIPLAALTTTSAAAVAGSWPGASCSASRNPPCAAIADMVPAARLGTAYDIFAAGLGGATLVGGLLTSALYDYSITAVTVTVAASRPSHWPCSSPPL